MCSIHTRATIKGRDIVTEIQLKFLALEVVRDISVKVNSRERKLANAILSHFDPEFFIKNFKDAMPPLGEKPPKAG